LMANRHITRSVALDLQTGRNGHGRDVVWAVVIADVCSPKGDQRDAVEAVAWRLGHEE
jgi:hypothetical protein